MKEKERDREREQEKEKRKKTEKKEKKEKLKDASIVFASSLNPDFLFPLSHFHFQTQQHNMELHWDKHHRAYVNNLNGQIKDTELDAVKDIEEVVKATWAGGKPTPAFNNAAQVWNHTFFWHSMSPTKSE